MGMPVVVEARDGDVPDEVFDWLHRVDETFSTYKDGSEISRLRRGELDETDASDDVRWVLRRCRELRDETAGYFDIDAVGLDPSGYVKGWAVERAAAILDKRRFERIRDQRRRRHPHARALAHRHPAPDRIAGGREGRRGGRCRDSDVRCVRARRAHPRSAHGCRARRNPLGDGHRARPRDRRCVRDRGVCDGRAARDRLDGAITRLRGADDPRGRARPRDAGLSVRRLAAGLPDHQREDRDDDRSRRVVRCARPRVVEESLDRRHVAALARAHARLPGTPPAGRAEK